jgi:phthiocerol/phenolphthiocerol synthesis type-I polyketide synthase C
MHFLRPLAIIGTSCRLPGGVSNLETLWTLLATGKDAITPIPETRWSKARFGHPDKNVPGRSYSTWAGLIDHIYDFDPGFFGISVQEAPYIDPQQRLALELSWEALEDAGIRPSSIAGSKTAVYFGASALDWSLMTARDTAQAGPRTMTGISLSIVANRVSYSLNLHGPSLTLDTACSSSLYALHQACQALTYEEAPMAIVGGVNVLLAPDGFIGFSKAGMLAPDGRCKTFDAAANGYVRGEGGGVIVLKPLDRAIEDKNHIRAVIRACATNSDGRTNGITLPNREAQATLLREIYGQSAVDPNRLVYLEAHGTGTSAGDPIEAGAIGAAIGRNRREPLYIGSIKTNIGHLEPGAGMAGIMKAILVLDKKAIPPNLHFNNPNPAIDFSATRLQVPTTLTPIPEIPGGQPCVGVNSFAFGGSNAHVVLESAPSTPQLPARARRAMAPLLLSARSPESLEALAGQYAALLSGPSAPDIYDLAANAAFKRDWLHHRLLVVAQDEGQMREALDAAGKGQAASHASCTLGDSVDETAEPSSSPRTAFVFSGNGSQWQGMGVKLMQTNPVFASAITRVDGLFQAHGGISVLEEMHRSPHDSNLDETEVAQPLLFAIQVGLVEALREKGIRPDLAFGHSVGEAAAAWCSGALSLEDAVAFIHHRGRFQATTKGTGFMTAANISLEEGMELARKWNGDVEVAGDNAAESITLSGTDAALLAIEADLTARNVFCKRLPLAYPFHSKWMDSFKEDLLAALAGITARPCDIGFISTVTGTVEPGETLNARYLWRNVREPVQFRAATETALGLGTRVFLEIGPHPVLGFYLKDAIRRHSVNGAALQVMRRNEDDALLFEKAWREAWANGWIPDLKTFFPEPFCHVELPRYQWSRRPARLEASEECVEDVIQLPSHPLLGWRKGDSHVWQGLLDTDLFPMLAGHTVMDVPVFPGTGYVEIALAAARELIPGDSPVELQHVAFRQSMSLPHGNRRRTRVVFNASDAELSISSRAFMAGEDWVLHMRCRVRKTEQTPPSPLPWTRDPDAFGTAIPGSAIYDTTPQYGFDYGPSFAAIERIWRNGPDALCRLVVNDDADHAGMLFSPALLDAAMHPTFLFLHDHPATRGIPFLPVSMDRVTMFGHGRPGWSLFRAHCEAGRITGGDLLIFDAEGKILLVFENVRMRLTDQLMSGANVGPAHVQRMLPAPHPADRAGIALPDPGTLREAMGNAVGNTPDPEFDQLLHGATVVAIHELLSSALAAEPLPLQEIESRLGSAPSMRPFVVFILETLADHELAEKNERGWRLVSNGDLPEFETSWRGLISEFPAHAAEIALLGRVRTHARPVIQGQVRSENVFISASTGTTETYHDHALLTSPVTECLRGLVSTFIDHCPTGEKLCFLELNAGSGKLLDSIVPLLRDTHCHYCASSPDLPELDALKSQWTGMEFLSFKVFAPGADDQTSQLPEDDAYHVILAPHCLHDAPDLPAAVQDCYKRLLPGGIVLLAQEKPSVFTNYVFGLSPTWWSHSPSPTEPASPLFGAHGWIAMFREAGFDSVDFLADTPDRFVLAARKRQTSDSVATCQPPLESRNWLILADEEPSTAAEALLEGVCRELRQRDQRSRVVHVGRTAAAEASSDRIDMEDCAAWRDLWAEASVEGKVHCVSLLGFDTDPSVSTSTYDGRLLSQAVGIAQAARGWSEAGSPDSEFWIVSGGGQVVPGGVPVPSQGAAWGLGRVLMNEMPQLHPRLIDIHPDAAGSGTGDTSTLTMLMRELLLPDSEEIVLAGRHRFVPCIKPLSLEDDLPAVQDETFASGVRLIPSLHKRIENIRWRDASFPRPGHNEVLVRTKAVGVNFRDIMLTLGLLPGEAFENGFLGPNLGCECSGIVEAVGEGVTDFTPGDEVAGMASGTISTYAMCHASLLMPKPAHLDHEQCATLPIAFSTAWYALVHQGRLQAGERILVHGAAGGVGLAAIQIANVLGAEVIATAGSPAKRDFLRLMGVRHVFDSRNLNFAEAVRACTDGQGTDLVLNCLAGEAMIKSLELLRPYGRFLELGKRDLFADTSIGLRALRQNISYFSIDIDAMAADKPELLREISGHGWRHLESGSIRPLPFQCFPARSVASAFRAMQQSRHIGKIVLRMDDLPMASPSPRARKLSFADDASYLVTGGTSGFGLATAKWMVEQGARHLLLASRSAQAADKPGGVADQLRAQGVEVRTVPLDVADTKSLHCALTAALETMPPLKGVIHGAAVLDDSVLTNMTPEKMSRVLAPKVLGAWNLHDFTRERELDFFVLFSSATTFIGSPGQGNYVAANAALETLAAYRRSQGLPALAVAWGPISDVGMLTRNKAALDSLRQSLGLVRLHSGKALSTLEKLLNLDVGLAAVYSADAKRILRLPSAGAPRFSAMRALVGETLLGNASITQSLTGKTRDEAMAILRGLATGVLASVLRLPEERINPDTPLSGLGVDSLMAVELGILLESTLGDESPHITISTAKTARELSESLYATLCAAQQ